MKQIKLTLLVIGILGSAAGIYGMTSGQELNQYLLSLVCGSSLIFGYFAIDKPKTLKE